MSNPKQSSNKAEFVALLPRLLEAHRQTYNDVSNATGIGEQILKNAYNGRNFGAKTSRINALKAYLAQLENNAPIISKEEKIENRIAQLEQRVSDLVKMLEGKNGVVENQMLADNNDK